MLLRFHHHVILSFYLSLYNAATEINMLLKDDSLNDVFILQHQPFISLAVIISYTLWDRDRLETLSCVQ